jgi:pilus assembly protein CpaF
MSATVERNAMDLALVAEVTGAVRERLAEASGGRGGRGRLSADDERQLARRLIAAELDRLAEARLAAGLDPITLDAEHAMADAVFANTMGLGRLQPHLDDPEVQDIHVRGSESTWLKLRDGRRRSAPPVVDRDEELIDLVRLVATRMGRTERRFDAAAPELNFQLPDGSACSR